MIFHLNCFTSCWLLFIFLLIVQTSHENAAAVRTDSNLQSFEYNTTTTLEKVSDNAFESINTAIEIGTLADMTREKKKNLTAITWAHAVNSHKELNEALNGNIDMIEADVVLGRLDNSGPELPVMAHPPVETSDITLESFLRSIIKHNEEHDNETKGIKLDFKTIEVFEGSLKILDELVPTMTIPIWLNADIVRGPVNETDTRPVDPARFLAGCARFERAVLSIGWTTRWGAKFNDGAYEADEIADMLQAIKTNNVTITKQPITFPVRAGIAANSLAQLHDLVRAVNETNESSLTIWSSQHDHVDIPKLRQLIFSFGLERVYLDVPVEVSEKLDLGRNSGRNTFSGPSLFKVSMVSVALCLTSLLLQRIYFKK